MDSFLWAVALGGLRYNNHLMDTISKNRDLYGWKTHRAKGDIHSKSNDVSFVGAHGKSIPNNKQCTSGQQCTCNIRQWLGVAAK